MTQRERYGIIALSEFSWSLLVVLTLARKDKPGMEMSFPTLSHHGGFTASLCSSTANGGKRRGLVMGILSEQEGESWEQLPEDADSPCQLERKCHSSYFWLKDGKSDWKPIIQMYETLLRWSWGPGPPYTIQLVLVFRQDLLNTCKPCVSVWILFVQITSSVVKLFLSDAGYTFVLYTHRFLPLDFHQYQFTLRGWNCEEGSWVWQQEPGNL